MSVPQYSIHNIVLQIFVNKNALYPGQDQNSWTIQINELISITEDQQIVDHKS